MLRTCIASLALMLCGCEWLQRQNIDFCVDYKGQHICVGRKDGKWVFSADLDAAAQEEIIRSIGQ